MAQRNNLARTCTSLLGAALVTAGLAGFTVGGAVAAGATVTPDGSPVCGPAMTITGLDTPSSPLGLTVPQYNGSATVSSAVLSIQVTESFQGSFLNGSGQPYPGTGSNDFVGVSSVLEATGPGLSALSRVTVGATFAGIGFNSFTAGNPLPAFPSGVAGAEAQNADGVGTGTAIPNTWTGLGFPFTPSSPSPATAKGTAIFTTSDASIPASNFGAYTGTGDVAISAADYSTDSVSSDSAGFNGASVPTSLVACVTYGVLGANLPEAPSVILIPASAAALALGAIVLVRRRNQHGSQAQ
jgi:hypothetical protein